MKNINQVVNSKVERPTKGGSIRRGKFSSCVC